MTESINKVENSVKCDVCEENFNSNVTLSKHQEEDHKDLQTKKEDRKEESEEKEEIEVKVIMEVKEEKEHIKSRKKRGNKW